MRNGFDRQTQDWIRVWAVVLLASCAAAVVVVLLAMWVLNGFHGLGVDGNILIALLLGTLGTVAMSVVLMGLVFYSNASRHDAEVRDLSVTADERDRDEDRR